MHRQLSNAVKIVKVADHTAAGTTTINSASVNLTGYKGVLFLTSFGTANAGNLVSVSQSSDDGSSDGFSDLAGTSVTSGSSDEDVWVDVYLPSKTYVRLDVTRGASTTCESIWALMYGGATQPETNATTGTITGEVHAAPTEGTA